MPKCPLRLLTALVLLAAAASAQPARPLGVPVDSLARAFVASTGVPSLVVGVSVGGERAVVGAGAVNGAAPDARTVYEIGSISKVLTALALADAVTRGETTLETPVADLLADTLAVASHPAGPIRLVDLATHTSGLPRLDVGVGLEPGFDVLDPYAVYSPERLATFLANVRPATAPGETVAYSNAGAGLLGYALAQRAGTPYGALVRDRVLAPLGMTDTALDGPAEVADRFAPAHDSSGAVVPHWAWTEPIVGAGGWRSTAADLLTLAEAAIAPDTTPLGEAMALALEPRVIVAGPQQIGLGWFVVPVMGPGSPAMALHDGGTGGARSLLVVVPEAGIAVVTLTNSQIGADRLGIALAQALTAAAQ